jgi:hypothetical protein
VRHALLTAYAARCGPVELHVSARHAFFRQLAAPVRLQRGADLGERMHHALRRALRRHAAALLMGADAPALKPREIARAARWLHGGADVVLAPAEDGGYALIGVRRIAPEIFAKVQWGSERVLAQTCANLVRAGLRVRLLPTLWDVDRPEDLERLRSRPLALAGPRRARRSGDSRRRSDGSDRI